MDSGHLPSDPWCCQLGYWLGTRFSKFSSFHLLSDNAEYFKVTLVTNHNDKTCKLLCNYPRVFYGIPKLLSNCILPETFSNRITAEVAVFGGLVELAPVVGGRSGAGSSPKPGGAGEISSLEVGKKVVDDLLSSAGQVQITGRIVSPNFWTASKLQ